MTSVQTAYINTPVVRQRRVLVVDDDEMVLQTTKLILHSAGFQSVLVSSGAEALKRLSEVRPEMILLDYMMPIMDGAAVYRKLQTDEIYSEFRDIPVIMLTAKIDNYDEQQTLLKMGLSAYLLKPFGPKELINIITNVLTVNDAKRENVRLQKQIQEIKNYLQSIFDSITDPISVQNAQFQIERYNHAVVQSFFSSMAREVTSFAEQTALGQPCYSVYFKKRNPCDRCPATETLRTGRSGLTEVYDEESGRYLQISTYPLFDEYGKVTSFVESIKDVTEKKKLENQLIESARLAGLGTLAAGVAHEVNNPLCIIIGFTQALLRETPRDHRNYEELKIIELEAARCEKVVKDLLAYARPGRLERAYAQITEIMHNSVSLIRHLIKQKNIVVRELYDNNIPDILMDGQKMQQVIVNLLMNAIHAIPSDGKITLEIQHIANEIAIHVRDSGIGMTEEQVARIFDPFYTTKAGEGTGLGLSISQSIIKEHDGRIEVKSQEGLGTTFSIFLPVYTK